MRQVGTSARKTWFLGGAVRTSDLSEGSCSGVCMYFQALYRLVHRTTEKLEIRRDGKAAGVSRVRGMC